MCHPHLTGREGKNSERHSSQGAKKAPSVPALAPTTVWSVSYMTDVYSLNCGTTVSPLPGPRQYWNLPGIEERANDTMLQAGRSTRRHRGPSRGHCPGQMVLWRPESKAWSPPPLLLPGAAGRTTRWEVTGGTAKGKQGKRRRETKTGVQATPLIGGQGERCRVIRPWFLLDTNGRGQTKQRTFPTILNLSFIVMNDLHK